MDVHSGADGSGGTSGPPGTRLAVTGSTAPRQVSWEPSWRVSRLLVRLGAVVALALTAAIATGRAELVVVAAPCLVAAVLAVHRGKPGGVRVTIHPPEERCFEDDELELAVSVSAAGAERSSGLEGDAGRTAATAGTRVSSDAATGRGDRLGAIGLRLRVPQAFQAPGRPRVLAFDTAAATATWSFRPRRWGSWTAGSVLLQVRTSGLAFAAAVEVRLEDVVTVFPPPSRARDLAVPPVLLDRMGTHVSRRLGTGSEFAEVRAYAPGDPVRRVNWTVSSRRGELFVNAFAAERAADVITVVDTTVDVGPWGRSSLDLAVRGAAGVVQAYLRYADRAGVVALGGVLRWLKPDLGMRQYYRVVETLLRSRLDDSFLEPELAHLPPQVLPPGALVFVFSPLLDPRSLEVIRNLRERGHPVVVVDVLLTEPQPERTKESRLALRLWRLEREALRSGLADLGVTVLPWEEGGVPLDRVRLEPHLVGARR